jgi:citrate lyase subunit gamma (acyl carrier protein)
MSIGICGSLESNDCLITAEKSDSFSVVIESIVFDSFGEQIRKVIIETLNDLNISHIKVFCNDKGALDYTIRARLITAIKRMEEEG